MRRLVSCAKPHEDEFWFGYLMRLADMNGYRSVWEFESRIFYSGHPPERRSGILYPSNAAKICRIMSDEPLFPDVLTVVDRMTTYRRDALGLRELEQARLLEYMMSDTAHAATPGVMTKYDKDLRFCPVCMEEDRKMYGHGYLHTMHQYRDTFTCRIHECALRVLKTSRSSFFARIGLDGGEPEPRDSVPPAEDDHPADIRTVRCPVCGTQYMIHRYSERSGMPCPVCAVKEDPVKVLQHRLDILYGGSYRIRETGTAAWNMTVEHIPCGSKKRNVSSLLWKERFFCAECRGLTVRKMQKRLDVSAPGYTVVRMVPKKNEKMRMAVRHDACGREFVIQAADMIRQPRCSICLEESRWKDIKEADPDYEVLEVPVNNRIPMLIRHKECGVVFHMLKQTYAEGGRCPVCTCRYTFQMVKDALGECAPGYSMERHKKRGYAVLYENGIPLQGKYAYREIIQDLAQHKGRVIKNVKGTYVPPVSKRAAVYMEVKKKTKEKGYWTCSDGIGGEPVSLRQKNIVQELTDGGFITRISTGRYTVAEEV